jgi:membrane protein YqaA with SNARE-associated domain
MPEEKVRLKDKIIQKEKRIKEKLRLERLAIRDKLGKIRNSPQYTYLHNLGLGFWIFLILTFSLGFIFTVYIESVVKIIVSDYGYIGIFFLVILLELLVQPVGPDIPLILGVLSNLNGPVTLLTVLIGSYVALYIAYNIGIGIGSAGIEKITGKKTFDKINTTTSKGGKWFMTLGALTPVPYIPYLSGLWKFSFKDCIYYVAIPRTIRLVIVLMLTYYFGVELLNINIIS